ncbi:MAG: glycerol-3-phosphate O-acyltransferase / dihydroxyacetone phosphate acyltransferase, partial [Acidobacteriota bacterium]|nr:glycerol-3-phosphate O-acyltransferase / dihydroxyacetone phosphate acyltransferase [Acidobacteriota bacterium]
MRRPHRWTLFPVRAAHESSSSHFEILRKAQDDGRSGVAAVRMTRRLVTAFFRLCVRIFFRRIELLGIDRTPDGPVVFAVNHPNGLVDPLFLLCFAPRPVSFLAKAPLLGYPVIGCLARAFDTIPVYRKQDNTTGSNEEMFSRAREVLQRGGSIAIFPEGTTHDDPRLRELKTGAARIALGADVPALTVVPTGIYYTDKHVFRSSALVLFGEPIVVQPLAVKGEPPVDAVEQLTSAIDAGLDTVTLQADSHAALALIARAEDIFTADDEQPLAEEFDLRRRFIEGYHYLSARDPKRLEQLQQKIAQFESELRRAKLDVHELKPRVDALRLFRVIVLLPLALAGAVLNYPTYRLIGFVAGRLAKGERNVMATMKFLGALLLFPLTYIAAAFFIGLYA